MRTSAGQDSSVALASRQCQPMHTQISCKLKTVAISRLLLEPKWHAWKYITTSRTCVPVLNSIYLPLLTIRNTGNYPQACPKGLDGTARWYCLPSGGWDGSVPDLSDCTKIDTDTSKSELKKNDSVPVEVRFLLDLHHHVTFCNSKMTFYIVFIHVYYFTNPLSMS